jgi:hypothetical protein
MLPSTRVTILHSSRAGSDTWKDNDDDDDGDDDDDDDDDDLDDGDDTLDAIVWMLVLFVVLRIPTNRMPRTAQHRDARICIISVLQRCIMMLQCYNCVIPTGCQEPQRTLLR